MDGIHYLDIGIPIPVSRGLINPSKIMMYDTVIDEKSWSPHLSF